MRLVCKCFVLSVLCDVFVGFVNIFTIFTAVGSFRRERIFPPQFTIYGFRNRKVLDKFVFETYRPEIPFPNEEITPYLPARFPDFSCGGGVHSPDGPYRADREP